MFFRVGFMKYTIAFVISVSFFGQTYASSAGKENINNQKVALGQTVKKSPAEKKRDALQQFLASSFVVNKHKVATWHDRKDETNRLIYASKFKGHFDVAYDLLWNSGDALKACLSTFAFNDDKIVTLQGREEEFERFYQDIGINNFVLARKLFDEHLGQFKQPLQQKPQDSSKGSIGVGKVGCQMVKGLLAKEPVKVPVSAASQALGQHLKKADEDKAMALFEKFHNKYGEPSDEYFRRVLVLFEGKRDPELEWYFKH